MSKSLKTQLPQTIGAISPPCRIITLRSKSGIALDGAIYLANQPRGIAVHIHGSLGNFYQNHFLRTLAREYTALGISLIAINLRSHDGIAEAVDLDRQQTTYIGGSLLPFESCISDIEGIIEWAEKLGLPVLLQGHSLGCDRVVAFALEKRWEGPLILLSPCDSKELQLRWGDINDVDWQARINAPEQSELEPFPLLPANSYGVIGSGDLWRYPIPTTARTLFSIMNGLPGTVFHLRHELLSRLDNNGYCYIGASDEILTAPPHVFAERIASLAPRLNVAVLEGGRHDLSKEDGWLCHEVAIGVSAIIDGSKPNSVTIPSDA